MKGSNRPRRGMSLALSRNFFVMLALSLATTLLIIGCKKADFIVGNDNTNSSGDTNSTSQSNNSNDPDVIKGKADEQGQATRPDKGNFTVHYSDVQDPRFVEINERFRKQRLLESIADELNASIAIPENVAITFRECGQPNAFWDPKSRSINMCYELMAQMTEDFRPIAKSEQDLNDKVSGALTFAFIHELGHCLIDEGQSACDLIVEVTGALTFAFIHELGHCLIDVLHLPSTGREEDAV